MPRIDAGGVELFYESAGEGVPIVFQAHHHADWMLYQFPYFSQFYRVIIYDRRGTGRSASPPGEWTTADFARDLKHLLDAPDGVRNDRRGAVRLDEQHRRAFDQFEVRLEDIDGTDGGAIHDLQRGRQDAAPEDAARHLRRVLQAVEAGDDEPARLRLRDDPQAQLRDDA